MADDAGILVSELRHVVDDLQRLVGGPIQEAWVPSPSLLILQVGRDLLHIETWPVPRLHTTERRPRNPKTPFSFQGLLRHRVRGPLERLAVLGNDRVVELDFGRHRLHVRLFGRGGGIWLLEDGDVVAAADGPAPPELPPLPESTARADPPTFEEGPEGWDRAARRTFDQRARQDALDRLRRRVGTHLKRQHQRALRLVSNLADDLERAGRADAMRHEADCLAASLHTLGRGASEAVVVDLEQPDQTITVSLDPALPPVRTMERLYDKARRLQRSAEGTLERLDAAETEAGTLKDLRETVAGADLKELRQLERTLRVPPERPPPQTRASRSPWVAWRGPEGQLLRVGRTAKDNHTLVFRHARGRDWWVHIRDQPGAHVVIQTDRNQPAPNLDTLLAAAELALRGSGVDVGVAADVQYARVADVRPVRGGAPGQVQVTDERVLHAVRDPSHVDGWTREN